MRTAHKDRWARSLGDLRILLLEVLLGQAEVLLGESELLVARLRTALLAKSSKIEDRIPLYDACFQTFAS